MFDFLASVFTSVFVAVGTLFIPTPEPTEPVIQEPVVEEAPVDEVVLDVSSEDTEPISAAPVYVTPYATPQPVPTPELTWEEKEALAKAEEAERLAEEKAQREQEELEEEIDACLERLEENNQAVIDIKEAAYAKVALIAEQPVPMAIITARQEAVINEANLQILKLDNERAQIENDCLQYAY